VNLVSSALCLRVNIAIGWHSELKKLKSRRGLTLAEAKPEALMFNGRSKPLVLKFTSEWSFMNSCPTISEQRERKAPKVTFL